MFTHLNALRLRLSNERSRFAADKAPLRAVWISQIEKEIASEIAFLAARGHVEKEPEEITDDELFAALA